MGRSVRIAVTVMLAGLAMIHPAHAEDACAGFKWPIDIERGWFIEGPALDVAVGGSVPSVPDRAIRSALAPSSQVALAVEPRRKPAPDSSSGLVTLASIPVDGTYQITLSDDAWIEVVQGDAAVPVTDFSGVKGCAGVRKSVRFDLKAGAAKLQITGAPASQILIAIRRVP